MIARIPGWITALLMLGVVAGCVTVDDGKEDKDVVGPATGAELVRVSAVLSGDRVKLESGEVLRYAGCTAPRQGEDFFEEARRANERLVLGKGIRVRVMIVEGKVDEHGHRFAHVYTPGTTLKLMVWVNTELVEGGWARVDYKALALKFESFFEDRETAARLSRQGIWKTRG